MGLSLGVWGSVLLGEAYLELVLGVLVVGLLEALAGTRRVVELLARLARRRRRLATLRHD